MKELQQIRANISATSDSLRACHTGVIAAERKYLIQHRDPVPKRKASAAIIMLLRAEELILGATKLIAVKDASINGRQH